MEGWKGLLMKRCGHCLKLFQETWLAQRQKFDLFTAQGVGSF